MKTFLIILQFTLVFMRKFHPIASTQYIHNDDLRIVEAAEDLMQAMIDESEILIRNALEDVPSDERYNEHRENLQKFLRETEEYRSEEGDCQSKRLKYNQNTSALMRPYLMADPNGPMELQVMTRLLNRHGLQDLRTKFKNKLGKVYGGDYGTPSKDIEKVYADYVVSRCQKNREKKEKREL
ncbi:uncharacterized protein [Musca autumnalis]|uniref:uncharacterized protein n=1 Tax=Musca autumnalis TaxID=221902 RepID=UPI003CF21E21